jgi:glyoxylase-like metal-dependent hydrolase (beta-lactamase superfamily II)
LFDTGVAPRIEEVTAHWPNRMYRSVVQFDCRPEMSLVRQLQGDGVAPGDVSLIVFSHVHADHVGGLLDFPNAEIVLSQDALSFARKMRGLKAVMNAYLPELMPADLNARSRAVACGDTSLSYFNSFDLFGDGTVRLVDLPGHAPGHIGMLTSAGEKRYFFVADACWHSRTVTHGELPHRATGLIVYDWKVMESTICRIRKFLASQPEHNLVPSHCPLATEKYLVGGRGDVRQVV